MRVDPMPYLIHRGEEHRCCHLIGCIVEIWGEQQSIHNVYYQRVEDICNSYETVISCDVVLSNNDIVSNCYMKFNTCYYGIFIMPLCRLVYNP